MTDTVTMYPKLEQREWIFTPPAEDPRDAEIERLKTALSDIVRMCDVSRGASNAPGYLAAIGRFATIALMPAPEGDMTITVEELDA